MSAGSHNLLDLRFDAATIVTPRLDASIAFYRDVLGYELVARSKLTHPAPTVAGLVPAGRGTALLRYPGVPGEAQLGIRLIEAAHGSKANRPRPDCKIIEPGLAFLECNPRDPQEAYQRLTKAGFKAFAPPQPFFYGPAQLPITSSNGFCIFGPAGEQLFFNCLNQPNGLNQRKPVTYTGIMGPLVQHVLMARDRWPSVRFYEKAFGLKPTYDHLGELETLNTAFDAPPKTHFRFVGMGERGGDTVTLKLSQPGTPMPEMEAADAPGLMEIWELRQWRPTPTPAWPTSLDRTGLAMMTVTVADLPSLRTRLGNAGLLVEDGNLPSFAPKDANGLYLRGAEGELIEVLARA